MIATRTAATRRTETSTGTGRSIVTGTSVTGFAGADRAAYHDAGQSVRRERLCRESQAEGAGSLAWLSATRMDEELLVR